MLSDWMLRLRALFRRTAVEDDIDAELQFHLDHQVQAHLARGLDRAEAMRRARLEFGGLDQIKEEYRDALGVRAIDRLRQDVRFALRSLRAAPTVTAVAVLSLGAVRHHRVRRRCSTLRDRYSNGVRRRR